MKSILHVTLTSFVVRNMREVIHLSGEYIFGDGKLLAQNHKEGAQLGNYPSIKDKAEVLAKENEVELLKATLEGSALGYSKYGLEDLIKKIGLDNTDSLLATLVTGKNQALFIDGFHVTPEFHRGWFERFDDEIVPDLFKVKLIQQQDGRQRDYLFLIDELMNAELNSDNNWIVNHNDWGIPTETVIEMM